MNLRLKPTALRLRVPSWLSFSYRCVPFLFGALGNNSRPFSLKGWWPAVATQARTPN
jgi:hypothetical protein